MLVLLPSSPFSSTSPHSADLLPPLLHPPSPPSPPSSPSGLRPPSSLPPTPSSQPRPPAPSSSLPPVVPAPLPPFPPPPHIAAQPCRKSRGTLAPSTRLPTSTRPQSRGGRGPGPAASPASLRRGGPGRRPGWRWPARGCVAWHGGGASACAP